MNNYLQIMIESLEKKNTMLDDIIEKNRKQAECIDTKEFDAIDWDDFNLLITEKEIIIEKLNNMDEGFQNLYDKIKVQLEENKDKYVSEIRRIQELIKILGEKNIQIQTEEEKNRQMIEKVLMGRKKVIRRSRSGIKVAQSYVQTMQGQAGIDLATMDTKK